MKRSLCFAIGFSLVLGGCDAAKPGAQDQPTVAAVALSGSAAPAALSAPAASAAPKAAWFLGKWSAKFKTEVQRIEMTKAEGAVVEWSKDNGTTGVGEVSLELDVNAEGDVSGGGIGALGKVLATGRITGDDLRVQLSTPSIEASKAFSGLLLATHSGEILKGKLQVSTGDSLLVRRAEVTLEKSKTAAPGP